MGFERIFTQGNLVDIQVSMWSGRRVLRAEDLGLEENGISDAFSLGHKKLLPWEVLGKFDRLEYHARKFLVDHSYPAEFGSARFVPKKCFVEFATEMDKTIAKFDAAADDLVKNYQRYKIQVRPDFVKAAHEAYKRVRSLTRKKLDEDTFVKDFLARVDTFYPDVSTLRRRFSLDYVVFQMALPDLTQATYEDIAEEQEKIKLLQSVYERNLNRRIEMFVDGLLEDQRSRAKIALENFNYAVREGGYIRDKSIIAIKRMIKNYEKMDVVGDEGFLSLLQGFKRRLLDVYTPGTIRDSQLLRKSIRDEVAALLSAVSNKEVIQALTKQYREKIKL
jgi:hypothetical protein